MPILLVFIQYKSVDVVGSGVAKQPLHPSVETSCNVSTKLWLFEKFTPFLMLKTAEDVVLFCEKLPFPPHFPCLMGKYEMLRGIELKLDWWFLYHMFLRHICDLTVWLDCVGSISVPVGFFLNWGFECGRRFTAGRNCNDVVSAFWISALCWVPLS